MLGIEFALGMLLVGAISALLLILITVAIQDILKKYYKKTNNKDLEKLIKYFDTGEKMVFVSIISLSIIISIFVNVIFMLNNFVEDKKDLIFINNIVKKINNKNIDINNDIYIENIFKIIDNKVYYSKNINYNVKYNKGEFYLYLIQFLPEDRKQELCLLIKDSLKNDELLRYKFNGILTYLRDSFEIISLSKEQFEEIMNSNGNNKKIIQDTIQEIKNECKNCIDQK